VVCANHWKEGLEEMSGKVLKTPKFLHLRVWKLLFMEEHDIFRGTHEKMDLRSVGNCLIKTI
jgi:hypothetical protein